MEKRIRKEDDEEKVVRKARIWRLREQVESKERMEKERGEGR
jgi:hypothetical protein